MRLFALCFAVFLGFMPADFQNILNPPYTCTTTTTLCHPGVDEENPSTPSRTRPPAVQQGIPGKRGAMGHKGEKGEKGDPCQCNVADEEAMREMTRRMDQLEVENQGMKRLLDNVQGLITPTNCTEAAQYYKRNDLSWVQIYPLKHIGDLTPINIRCPWDEWIVFQRRFRGSIDFYRDWESYARGFGDRNDEFWLGLRTIHALTSSANYKLRIDLKLNDGSIKYAEYSVFRLGNEEDGFRMTISGYSGNSVDYMANHNGYRFTTNDRDLDVYTTNCAVKYVGAWWYTNCYHANLNGRYGTNFYWRSSAVSSSEMKIQLA